MSPELLTELNWVDTLISVPARASHVLGHRGPGHLDAKSEKLPLDPRCSLEGIGRTHLPNEFTNFPSHGGPPGCAAPTFPGPIQPESFAVPGYHRFGLYDQQRRAPSPPEARQPNPQQSVRGVKTKPAALRPFQDCNLVADSKNLDLQRCPSPEPRSEASKQGKKERGKHRAARLTRALSKINDFRSDQILGRHKLQ